MDPHKIAVEVVFKGGALAAMPGEIHNITLTFRVRLYMPDLAFAESINVSISLWLNSNGMSVHFCPPVPRVAKVSHQRSRFASIIDACGVHPGQGASFHLYTGAVWPIYEASRLVYTTEFIAPSESLRLFFEGLQFQERRKIFRVRGWLEDRLGTVVVCVSSVTIVNSSKQAAYTYRDPHALSPSAKACMRVFFHQLS